MVEQESNIVEEWRPVVGYEGFYAVSNLGNVKRLSGTVNNFTGDRLLKPCLNKTTGYFFVSPCVNGRKRLIDVHRLVAAAFIGPCPPGHNVNHIDTVKTNNRVTNLEYKTFQGNSRHAAEHGLMPTGERHGSRTKPGRLPTGDNHWTHRKPDKVKRGEAQITSRLTAEQVREIRRRYLPRVVTVSALAQEYSVSRGAINEIVQGRNWKHVK